MKKLLWRPRTRDSNEKDYMQNTVGTDIRGLIGWKKRMEEECHLKTDQVDGNY
jgi:hypothetical protein